MVTISFTEWLTPHEIGISRRRLACEFLFVLIAGSLTSSSRAFVNNRPAYNSKWSPTPCRDVFGAISNGMRMSTAEAENPVSATVMEEEDEENMNVITLKGLPMKATMPKFESNGPVTAIQSTEHFLHLLDNAPKDGLVVIKYHAKFCKVCARVILKYKKMANRMMEEGTPVPVTLADVELTANSKLCATLGIKKFPYLQIYRNMECVASFGTGPAHNFQRAVGGTIQDRLATTDEEWETIRSDLSTEIANGLEEIRILRQDVADMHLETTISP